MANFPDNSEANRTSTQLSSHTLAPIRMEQRETIMAYVAAAALLIIVVMAFFCSPEKVVLADRITLLALGVAFLLLLYPPLLGVLERQSGGVTFFITAAMFVVYSLARRVAPEAGPSIRFALMPEDEFIFPYSAYVAVIGSLIVAPYWWKMQTKWPRALLGGLAMLALLAAFSFWLLGRNYPVGTTERVDPSPLPPLFFMLIEYGCLALLCRAVGSNPQARRWMIRVLPPLLLALWARFHFMQPTEEAE